MARKPSAKPAAKKSAKNSNKPKAKHGGKVVTKADQAAAQASAVPPTIKLCSPKAIRDLINAQLIIQGEIAGLSGDMGKMASTAAEKSHVNKKAAGITKGLEQLHRKNPKRFQEVWYNLQHYFEAMGFQKKAEEQGQFDLQQATAAEADDGVGPPDQPEGSADEPAGTDGVASPGLKLVDTEAA